MSLGAAETPSIRATFGWRGRAMVAGGAGVLLLVVALWTRGGGGGYGVAVATVAASTGVATGLAGLIAVPVTDVAQLLAIPGAIAVLITVLAVVMRWPSAIVGAVLLIGLEYTLATITMRRGADFNAAAPLVGVGLLLLVS
jgi:hypothetical protein